MKPHSRAAECLRVSTGKHAMILGRFYRSIKECEKPKGLDKDVIVESDVWKGRNVTLLSGVHIATGLRFLSPQRIGTHAEGRCAYHLCRHFGFGTRLWI